ncbi:ferrochelatase [Leptospirillum ferriphilum]|jgi:ferrochelatase|uniref:ferrochelatase n=1 Tax=Leptospirillum ferriphilum TaxID=178606 RepID=UPI003EE4FD5A
MSQTRPETPKSTRGVLLFNLGGPETLEDVYPFLLNLFSDPDIFRVPRLIQPLLARIIARRRAPKSREYYRQIGGGSPLRKITDDQARLLEEALNREKTDVHWKVRVGMRYAPPRTADALRELVDSGVNDLVFLPLYPQRSRTTTGSSFREALAEAKRIAPGLSVRTIPSWPVYPPYIQSLAETVGDALRAIPEEETVHILFSAHGIPEFLVTREKDPYEADTNATVSAAMETLHSLHPRRKLFHHLSYQSRVGPLKWLGPETRLELSRLAGEGVRHLVMVPVSFVSDHQETLYEMDILYGQMTRDLGYKTFLRAPSLNTRPSFINALASLLREASDPPCASAPCFCSCGACPKQSG